MTVRTLGETIAETRSFNSRNQLTGVTAAANSATLLNLGYGYGTDNNGQIRTRTDGVQPEHSVAYSYDALKRLESVSGGDSSWGISWGLDRYGNRTSQTPTGLAVGRVGSPSIAYNSQNRNMAWTYDAAGNVTNDNVKVYTYDAESRLIQVGNTSILYAYDAAGRRIRKTIGSESTYYLYGIQGLISEFTTVNTGATAAASDDRLQYRISEQTGTPVMLVDANGIARENNRVFPFGEPWNLTVSSPNDQDFTTYQRDGESGLDYAMARYYASRSGRFMTPDPGHVGANVGDPQSWNAYTYTMNDPINLIDPNGLFAEEAECTFTSNGDGSFTLTCTNSEGGPAPESAGFSAWYWSLRTYWDRARKVFLGDEAMRDYERAVQTFFEQHRAVTRGLSPVPTTTGELGFELAVGPLAKIAQVKKLYRAVSLREADDIANVNKLRLGAIAPAKQVNGLQNQQRTQ